MTTTRRPTKPAGGIRAKPDNLSVAQRTHVSDLPPSSVLPQPFEPLGGKLGVAHRVLDVLVAQVRLQRPGIVPLFARANPQACRSICGCA